MVAKTKILFFASNPVNTERLELDDEVRLIRRKSELLSIVMFSI